MGLKIKDLDDLSQAELNTICVLLVENLVHLDEDMTYLLVGAMGGNGMIHSAWETMFSAVVNDVRCVWIDGKQLEGKLFIKVTYDADEELLVCRTEINHRGLFAGMVAVAPYQRKIYVLEEGDNAQLKTHAAVAEVLAAWQSLPKPEEMVEASEKAVSGEEIDGETEASDTAAE